MIFYSKLRSTTFLGSSALFAILAVTTPAIAQDTAPPRTAPQGSGQIEDIVVTAQRREESLQKVPLAVTALSSERMQDAGISNYTQLQEVTPGLVSQGSNGNATPFIRGIGALGTNPGNDAPVATYVDGVYVSSKKSNLMAVTDAIERIEVLRGPQGTLFGRNSTGGALRILTKDPSQDTQGSAQVYYGRFNKVGGQLYATTGLTDTIAVNIAASYDRDDGYIRNLAPAINGGGSKVGENEAFTVRAKLKFEPTDTLNFVFAADYAYSDRSAATAQTAVPGFTTVPFLTLGPNNPLGAFTLKPRTYIGTNDPISDDRNYGFSLNANWDLGAVELTSVTSYRHDKAHNAIDLDLAPLDLFLFEDFQVTKTFQQELRLASSGESPLRWQTGVFYMHDNAGFTPLRALLNTTLRPTPAELAADTNATRAFTYSAQIVKSMALFGELTYDFGGTRLTGGVRGTRDKVTFDPNSRATLQVANAARTGFDEIDITPAAFNGASKAFKELTYRINLDHDFADGVMGYASFNRGFKSGVFNISALANTTPTEPEIVRAYEVGAKMDLFDRHFRLNVSAFYNDYSNLQVQVTDTSGGGVQRTENAAAARIYGAEVEATIQATPDLTIIGNMSYLNSKYTKYLNASVYEVQPSGLLGLVPRDLRNQQTPFAPKLTFSLSAQYTVRLDSGARVNLDGNYFYNDGYCIEAGCLTIARQKSFSMMNLSATYYAPDDRFFLRAYGKNLLNEKVFSGNTVTNFGVGVTWNEPATWGVAAGIKF